MLKYLKGIWRCRYFWLMLVKNDLRQRYRRSMLGMGWSLLQPVAMTAIICFVFHTILRPDGDLWAYAAFVLAGLACWNFLVTTTVQGCQCLFQGENYIRQYPAPMAIYPLRTALAALFHFVVATGVVIALAWMINGLGNIVVLPALVLSMAILFVTAWALAVLAGFANVFFQDTQHLSDVGFQIFFYLTPIIYPASLLRDRNLGWIADGNPFHALMRLVRTPVLEGQLPNMWTWTLASGTALVLASTAGLVLMRLQKKLIFSL